MVLTLAEKLKKFPAEIEEAFGEADLVEWGEFWKRQADEREKAMKAARSKR
jgi:hypothetical protein